MEAPLDYLHRDRELPVEISVTDNGPGIPEQAQAQLFERFSQLEMNDRRGLGLGLFIAKWIVESHKGRIWVTSGPEREAPSASHFIITIDLKSPVHQSRSQQGSS